MCRARAGALIYRTAPLRALVQRLRLWDIFSKNHFFCMRQPSRFACSRRPAFLRLGLETGQLCCPWFLALVAVHPGCSRRLRAWQRNGRGSRARLWGQGLALRRPPFRSCEKEAKPRAGALDLFKDCALESPFPTPFLLTAPKETVSDRQRKALSSPSVHPFMDRRIRSGHSLPPAPLPLMLTKTALSAAHNSAPGLVYAVTRRVPWDRHVPSTANRAAAETGSTVRRLTSTPDGSECTSYPGPP